MSKEPTYKIVRMFFRDNRKNRVIKRGLTLREAQEHCSDPETSSETCKSARCLERNRRFGPWFDGYEQE